MSLYISLIDRLNTQHLSLAEIIKNIPAAYMTKNAAPGKWSIHENIGHLARYQVIFIERIHKVLTDDVPHFNRYKADNDPEFEPFRNASNDELMKCLNAERNKLVQLILNLPGKELERTGAHEKYGPLTIVQWTEFFLLHEAHHLFTIFQLANDVDLQTNHT